MCLFPHIARSQSNQALRNQAFYAMQNKDWYNASRHYKKLYLHDSTDRRAQYGFAEAALRDGDIDQAHRLLLNLAAYDNGRRFPLVYYYLGEVLRHKMKYREAQQWYLKFNKLRLKKEKYQYYKKKAKQGIEGCDLASVLLNSPHDVSMQPVGSPVNSVYSEYAPVEYDSVLYFSAMRNPSKRMSSEPFSKIYRIAGRRHEKAVALDTTINSGLFHSANLLFVPGKKQIIFSRCVSINASDYRCDLFTSSFIRNRWQNATRMDSVNYNGYSTTQPAIGTMNGKQALFFSSNRPGGFGGMDIWYAVSNDNGWDTPVNAGKKINSPDDEITPQFDSGTGTLYFSSTWHPGLGGFDIFKSEFRDGQFGAPVNAGLPLNSSFNDSYYWSDGKGLIYLSSNRPGSMFEGSPNCCSDIYRLRTDTLKPPPPIDSVAVLRGKIRLLVPLTLYFHNDQPDPATRNITTSYNYQDLYLEYKKLQEQYAREFSRGSENRKQSIAETENFFRDSVDGGMEALDKFASLLAKTLDNGETVKITMKGYCSPLATTDYNVNLAKRRISSLRNYFVKWNNGFFTKYIDNVSGTGGRILFEDVDIGELPASRVSDKLNDKRSSVYSPQAASERKIQIIAIGFGDK